MHVLDTNELFGVTIYTFDMIMETGGRIGPDAFALYFKLMKQARIQQTNQTYSLNEFLKRGMGRGDDRLRNAKNVLKKLGLIDEINIQDEKGKITGRYIRVNYLINEDRVRTLGITYNLSTTGVYRQTVTPTDGGTDANALSTKYINALSTKHKYTFEDFWKDYPHARKGKKSESETYFKKCDSNEVRKQVSIMKWKLRAGLIESKYIPACERWIRDFTPINDDVINQDLVKICRRHLNAGGDMKERSLELKQTFGDERIDAIVKAVQQKNNLSIT